AISATFGTLCVPLAYLTATRIAGRVAGILAALLVACAVVQVRESHFFSVDTMMLGFATASLYFAVRLADQGQLRVGLIAGAFVGASAACKYTALFLLLPLGVAYLLAPGRPARWTDLRGVLRWALRGALLLIAAAGVFAAS